MADLAISLALGGDACRDTALLRCEADLFGSVASDATISRTIRDIQHHLAATLGTELSHETISNVTDAVLEEVKAWQSRPLEPFYPVIFMDALVVKVRDGAHVTNRSAHIAVGVQTGDGPRLVEGATVHGWKAALGELALIYPDRMNPHL